MQVASFLHTYIWSYLHPTPSKRPDAIKLGVIVENAELDPATSKSLHPKSQPCSTNQGPSRANSWNWYQHHNVSLFNLKPNRPSHPTHYQDMTLTDTLQRTTSYIPLKNPPRHNPPRLLPISVPVRIKATHQIRQPFRQDIHLPRHPPQRPDYHGGVYLRAHQR